MWVNACEISIIYAFSCMGLHQFYYTGGGICVKIYNNNFKGGGGHLIYEKKNHQRFRNVAECLVQAKLTPHCKNGNVDIYMEHIFFLMWTFYRTNICLKIYTIYMYIYRLDAGSDSETSLRENIKPYSQFTH